MSRDCRGIGTAERKKAVEIFDSGGNHETANRGVGPDGFVVKHVHSDEMTYLCYGTVGKSEPFQHAFGDVRRNRFMAVKGVISVIIHGPGTGFAHIMEECGKPDNQVFPRSGSTGQKTVIQNIEPVASFLFDPAAFGKFRQEELEKTGRFKIPETGQGLSA